MTLARIAAQLDPATELDDFQVSARTLLTHGLITGRFPQPGALALVRRFEEPLRNEFNRLCHWRLDVGPTCARLLRRPAALSRHRPARTASQSRRPFSPQTYASLCLVLAALEGLGEQTTITHLADEVARLRAGDAALPFDLTVHTHRRAFVDAVAWLEQRGVLTLLDGDTEHFLTSGGDALYDVDRDAASRLLVSPPSVLAGLTAADDFLNESYPPTPEGAQARARHGVHRRLLTEAVVYYDDLPAEQCDYARQRRTRIREELERLTGCILESRAEGQALIGLPAAEPFPAGGTVTQAALLLATAITDVPSASAVPRERVLTPAGLNDAWDSVTAGYGRRFSTEYRAEPQRLLAEVLGLLERLVLVTPEVDGAVRVAPALARYRADGQGRADHD